MCFSVLKPPHERGMAVAIVLPDISVRNWIPSRPELRRQRSDWMVDAMKPETPAQRFRREANECKLNAQSAMRAADREAWLKLASDWMKLAESADLNPILERLRH